MVFYNMRPNVFVHIEHLNFLISSSTSDMHVNIMHGYHVLSQFYPYHIKYPTIIQYPFNIKYFFNKSGISNLTCVVGMVLLN